jgi:hypothetical protein
MDIDKAMSKILTTKNKSAEFGAGTKDDEDDDISIAADSSAMKTIDFFTAESHLLDIRHFAESIDLPENDIKILNQLKRHFQMHQINMNSAKAIGKPTLHRLFAIN